MTVPCMQTVQLVDGSEVSYCHHRLANRPNLIWPLDDVTVTVFSFGLVVIGNAFDTLRSRMVNPDRVTTVKPTGTVSSL